MTLYLLPTSLMIFIQVVPGGAYQEMNLFLQNHSFRDFLALILLGHVVRLDDFNQLFLPIYPECHPRLLMSCAAHWVTIN